MIDGAMGGDLLVAKANCGRLVGGVAAVPPIPAALPNPLPKTAVTPTTPATSVLPQLDVVGIFAKPATPSTIATGSGAGVSIVIGIARGASTMMDSVAVGRVGERRGGISSICIGVGSIAEGEGMNDVEATGSDWSSGSSGMIGDGERRGTAGAGAIGIEGRILIIVPFKLGSVERTAVVGAERGRELVESAARWDGVCEFESRRVPVSSLERRGFGAGAGAGAGIGIADRDFEPYEMLEAALPAKFLVQFDSLPAAAESAPPNCVNTLF